MTVDTDLLPSWRPGRARDEILAFLDLTPEIPPEQRLACFDNDGTLWCEKPHYVQLDFLLHSLGGRVAEDPALGAKPEFAALISRDADAVRELGLPRIALALTGLFDGMAADRFGSLVRDFMAGAVHPTLHRPLRTCLYRPMTELLDALRRHGFTVARRHRRRDRVRPRRERRPVRRTPRERGGHADRLRLRSGVGRAHPDQDQPAARRPQRRPRQGVAHPGPARAPAGVRRRQHHRRPGDAALGRHGRRPVPVRPRGPRRPRPRVRLPGHRGVRPGSRADRRRGAPTGLDRGQHGPGLGDGLRPRRARSSAGPVATAAAALP